ncbi:MAG: rhodanese-like domain-containing protein [Niabella sp.]
MEALSAEEFEKLSGEGMTIADVRDEAQVKPGFIKGSIVFGSIEKFKEYAGTFLGGVTVDSGFAPFLLVYDMATKDDLAEQTRRLGLPVKGYLNEGFDAWVKAGGVVDMIIDVEADELMMDIRFDENLIVMDIRSAIAFADGHLKDAINLPLADMTDPLRLAAIEDTDNLYLLGDSDEDSFLAASILKKHEIHNLRVVSGGWEAVKKQEKAEIVKEPGMLN